MTRIHLSTTTWPAVALVVGLAVGATTGAAAPPQARPTRSPQGSVEVGVPAEKTTDQKIAELNAKILADPKNGDNYNDLGVLYTSVENWPLARDAFIRAVQAKPYDADYHRNLGLVFQKLGDHDLAVSEFAEYIKLGMSGAHDGWRLLGRAREAAGDTTGASQAYAEGLKTLGVAPVPEVMRLVLAASHLDQEAGNESAAVALLEKYQPVARQLREQAAAAGNDDADGVAEAKAIESNLVAQYIENGKVLEQSGMASDAAELYEKVYALAPDRDDLLPHIVDAYLAAGETMKAKVAARLARQDHPDEAGSWIASAKIDERENDLKAAIKDYEKAYELSPDNQDLAMVIGNLYLRTGQAAEGRRYLEPLIQSDDTPTEVVYNYAVSLIQGQKYSAAIAPLRRVVRERPEYAAGWSALAQVLRATQQYTAAIGPYQKALALAPDAKLAYNLGVCATKAGQLDTAIAAYQQAVELDPSSAEAQYNLGLVLMKAKRYDEALATFDRALALDPHRYEVLLNEGVCLYHLKRNQEAIDKYNLALEQKETPVAYDNLGLAFKALGDSTRAQTCFKEAKKLRGGK